MAAPSEVLISSEQNGQLWSSCIWEIQSGQSLVMYKGASAAPRSLNVISSDYLVSAQALKPVIQFWTLNRREQMHSRMVCPGTVTALTFTPDSTYCIAAVAEKIHIWQVATGNLLAVLSRHYQNVTCLKTTDDGSHFVSAGDDNIILVWDLYSIIGNSGQQTQIEPRYSWSKHSLPVTDVFVGCGGATARVISVSLDQTCKVWDMASGELLCTFVFDISLCSVASDAAEQRIFVGTHTGDIFQVNLFEKVSTERHIQKSDQTSLVFQGHSKQVTCLCVSMDATTLISGSHDFTVKIWDIFSRQCTKVLSHKGAVTNLLLIPTPVGILSTEDRRQRLPLQNFKRHLQSSDTSDSNRATLDMRIKSSKWKAEDYIMEQDMDENTEPSSISVADELRNAKAINKELYQYAVNKILKVVP